jgi:hypothetical protein
MDGLDVFAVAPVKKRPREGKGKSKCIEQGSRARKALPGSRRALPATSKLPFQVRHLKTVG